MINIFHELEDRNSNKQFIFFLGSCFLSGISLSLSASINSSLLSGDRKIKNIKTIFPLINRCMIDKLEMCQCDTDAPARAIVRDKKSQYGIGPDVWTKVMLDNAHTHSK